jgi:hypothetical protein
VSRRSESELAADGRLAAHRTSGGWLISAADIADRGASELRGRPIGPNTAWALIVALSGGDVTSAILDRSLRSRINRLIHSLPDPATAYEPWRSCLGRRHALRRFWVHPGVLERLRHDSRVSLGGLEVVGTGDGLTGRSDRLDLYAVAVTVQGLTVDYRLRNDPRGAVFLHVVPDSVRSEFSPHGGSPVPKAAGAADLLDEDDPRAKQAGADLLHDMRVTLGATIQRKP